jgi:hypothetical protein
LEICERMAVRSSGIPVPVRAEVSMVGWLVVADDLVVVRSDLLRAIRRGRVVREAMVASS